MATNFPTSIDSFTNPSSGDTLDSPSHSAQHTNINDAMVAVQTKLGVGAGTIGEWTTFTPTVTAGSGTPTTFTAIAKYVQINKLVVMQARVDITNKGTAGGSVELTLPVTASGSNRNTAFGRETSVTGHSVNGEILSGNVEVAIRMYANGTPWVNGYGIAFTVIYEAA